MEEALDPSLDLIASLQLLKRARQLRDTEEVRGLIQENLKKQGDLPQRRREPFQSYRDPLAGEIMAISGGNFLMGSRKEDEAPMHEVRLSDFYLGKYEVTVAQFRAFVAATGYETDAERKGGTYVNEGEGWIRQSGVYWIHDAVGTLIPQTNYNHPVIHVSWNDAMAYCQWLSQQTGVQYRLPTEAEWEYAAGGGSRDRSQWGSIDREENLTS
jgi:formylglycine-generating enzyme required for sulfatase activity